MIFDAIRFLTEHNIDYSTFGKNVQKGWAGITCPMCGDVSNHGGFNLDGGYYNCWKCGGHSVITIIKSLLNCTYNEADRIYNEFSDKYVIHKLNEKKKKVKKVTLPGSGNLLSCDRKYLQKRGFDPDYIVNRYQVKGSEIMGDWRYRIIIPIIYQGRIVAFQGRDVTNKQYLRYKTLEKEMCIVDPKSTFYGIDQIQGDTVAVVEGVIDCWKMGEGFIASLGKNITSHQIKLLLRFKRVFWLIDCNDERSKEFAEKAAKDVSVFGVECIIFDMQNKCDPGELTEREVKEVRGEMKL
jgi:DNA primase